MRRREGSAALWGLALAGLLAGGSLQAVAQVMGEEAEMTRLYDKAEEAIANDDPEGAAMSSGRAALMASELAKQAPSEPVRQLFRGSESLFRGHEQAYRALALFHRAGGQPPASTGVCRSIEAARQAVQQAVELLAIDVTSLPTPALVRQAQRWHDVAVGWVKMVAALAGDFQCQPEASSGFSAFTRNGRQAVRSGRSELTRVILKGRNSSASPRWISWGALRCGNSSESRLTRPNV